MARMARPDMDSEDLEDAMFSGTDNDLKGSQWSMGRIATAGLGLACLVACGVATAMYSHSSRPEPLTGRYLLEDPEMLDVMTHNTMKSTGFYRPEDKSHVRGKVAEVMRKITDAIRVHEPDTYRRLHAKTITPEEKSRVLKVVASMNDPRVQQLGKEVAAIVVEHKQEGREAVKRELLAKFEPRAVEMRKLKSEIFQNVGADAHLSFHPEHMKIVNEVAESTDLDVQKRSLQGLGSEITDADMATYAKKFEEGLGIVAGMIEQCRVCLDQIDFIGESFGRDMKIPYWAKSLVGGLDFVTELSDCVMRASSNYVKTVMCPMKYASAFSDFMSSFDNLFGVSNGHFSLFGGGSATTKAPVAWGSFIATPPPAPASHGWSFGASSPFVTTTVLAWGR